MPLNTCAHGPLEISRRNSENMVLAFVGMILSIVPSTNESLTCPTTTGKDDAVSTDPMAQAMSSMDRTLTIDPPTESRMVDDGFVTDCLTAAPIEDATNCPRMAALTSSTTATIACWVCPPTMACEIDGPNWAPSTAPPT